MKIAKTAVTAMVVCAAVLSAAPVAAASTAAEAPAQVQSSGHVEMTVKRTTASTVTFDVGGGARPVKSKDGKVRVTDGNVTSEALPTKVSVEGKQTVRGSWTVDDSDTITFHFAPSQRSGAAALTLSSDWSSKEWGHCVSESGIAGAAVGGFVGAITGPGAITSATVGLLGGIIHGAIKC
jgi:hypothetical protein